MDRLRRAAARIDVEHARPVGLHLAEGNAHAEIARRASVVGADLLVIGAHGEHFLLDMFVGTTLQRAQRLSTVLVVRQASFYRHERVLIATDFSPASVAAAGAALRLFPDATFHVFHAFETSFESRLGVNHAAIESHRRQIDDQARREINTFVREAGLDGRTTSVQVRRGYAPMRIKERAADLVVLGTQGKSWLAIGFLGSVSEHVAAESSADVLLVRPPGYAEVVVRDRCRAQTLSG